MTPHRPLVASRPGFVDAAPTPVATDGMDAGVDFVALATATERAPSAPMERAASGRKDP